MLKVGHPCSYVCAHNPMLMGKQSLTQSCNKYKALKKKNNIDNNINKSHHKTHLETNFFHHKVNMRYLLFQNIFRVNLIFSPSLCKRNRIAWFDICASMKENMQNFTFCIHPLIPMCRTKKLEYTFSFFLFT